MNTSKDSTIPSIHVLHQERFVKENSRMDIFNIVLNKIVNKIVYTNRHTDKTYIIYEVPKILIGYPQYDMKSCLLFIINKLSANGYIVEFIEPFYLYIDWGSNNTAAHNKKVVIPSITTKNPDRLRAQTKALLSQFPNASEVEFVYEDQIAQRPVQKNLKNNKKNKK